jgi:uncharacterized delta-60 repeat protein
VDRLNCSIFHQNFARLSSAPAARRRAAIARAVAHAEPLESRTLFSALALDAHFGAGGTATFDFSHSSDQGFSTYPLGNGKTLVAGSGVFNSVNSGVLARLNADGTLDQSFGTGGFTVAPNSGGGVIAVDATGDIYVAGGTWHAFATEASVTRYHADGSLDTSFGTGGIAFANFVTGAEPGGAGFSAIALQQDGKIVAVGTSTHSGIDQGDIIAARFNVDGSEDTTFGLAHGQVTLSFGTSTLSHRDDATALAIASDGKIVIGGDTNNSLSGSSLTQTFTVVRLNTDGTADSTFGDGGHVMTLFHDADTSWIHADRANITSLLVEGDGKIVAVGMGNSGQMAAARYNADGSLDSTFAYNGTLLTSALNNGNYTVHGTSDGGFEVAGAQKDPGTAQTVYYGRFDQGGNLVDSATFDGSAAPNPVFSTVAFAPDGGLVVAGATYASAPGGSDPNWYLTGDVLVAKFDVVAGPTNGGGTTPGGGTDASGGSPTGGTTTDGGSTSGPTSTDSGSGTSGTTPGGSVTGLGAPTGLVNSVALVHPLPVMHLSSLSKSKPGKLYRFTVTYTSADNQPIATSDVSDISITGPAGWQGTAQVIKSHQSHHGKRRRVTYAVQLPPGTSAAGLYTLTNGATKAGAFTVVGRTKKASH